MSLILMPPTVLGLPVAAVPMLILAGRVALGRQPRRAASFAAAALLPALLWSSIRIAVDYPHLALTAWLGVGQLGNVPAPPHGFTAYDWSIGLITNGDTFLLYDPTDRIAHHTTLRRFTGSYLDFDAECAGKADHLLGHYYICTF